MSVRIVLFSILLLITTASGIAVAWSRHQHRVTFTQFSAAERERDELNIEFDRLQLEIATLVDAQRIGQRAQEQLGMRTPEPADIAVVMP